MAVTLNASTSTGYIQTADTSGDLALQSNGTTQFTVSSTGAYGQLKAGTAVTASGTSVEFTNLPSWVRRITLLLNGISTNGTAPVQLQLGTTSGFEITGYLGTCVNVGSTASLYTTGLGVTNGMTTTSVVQGLYSVCLVTGNTWSGNGCTGYSNTAALSLGAGGKALSGVLDRVRVIASTTGSPADTFDAGTINILYEG